MSGRKTTKNAGQWPLAWIENPLDRPRSRWLKIAQDEQPDKDKTPVGSPRRR
jgi:hypothetical protein